MNDEMSAFTSRYFPPPYNRDVDLGKTTEGFCFLERIMESDLVYTRRTLENCFFRNRSFPNVGFECHADKKWCSDLDVSIDFLNQWKSGFLFVYLFRSDFCSSSSQLFD